MAPHWLWLAAIRLNPDEIGLPNSTTDVGSGITKIIQLLFVLIGSLAVIFMIIGGLQITTAAGNPARLKQGRESVIYAAVGLVVSMGAYALVTFISSTLK